MLHFPFLCSGGMPTNAWVYYTNNTPRVDYIQGGIAPGDTWTATSQHRGLSKVWNFYVWLTLSDDRQLRCDDLPYQKGGTTDYLFSILMDGVDRCCVRSSQDDTPIMRCAGSYSGNVPDGGREAATPTFPWVLECPQSKPSCVNYVYNDHLGVSLGTCVATCD